MKIPKGAIAERVPRPLKPSEVKRLREQAGEPTPEGLESLAAKFARVESQQEATTAAIKHTTQNLWQKGDL